MDPHKFQHLREQILKFGIGYATIAHIDLSELTDEQAIELATFIPPFDASDFPIDPEPKKDD